MSFRAQFPPEGIVIWRDLQRVLDRIQDHLTERLTEALADRIRIEVVTELPASAPVGRFFVMAGDTNIYVGAGNANPLRKITTGAV